MSATRDLPDGASWGISEEKSREDALVIVQGLTAEEILQLMRNRLTHEELLQYLRAGLAAHHQHQRQPEESWADSERSGDGSSDVESESLVGRGNHGHDPTRQLGREALSWKVLLCVTAIALIAIYGAGYVMVSGKQGTPTLWGTSKLLQNIELFYQARSKWRNRHQQNGEQEARQPLKDNGNFTTSMDNLMKAYAMSHRLDLALKRRGDGCTHFPAILTMGWVMFVVYKIFQDEQDQGEDDDGDWHDVAAGAGAV